MHQVHIGRNTFNIPNSESSEEAVAEAKQLLELHHPVDAQLLEEHKINLDVRKVALPS